MSNYKDHLRIRITEEQKLLLEEKCKKTNSSVSKLIRKLIDEYLIGEDIKKNEIF